MGRGTRLPRQGGSEINHWVTRQPEHVRLEDTSEAWGRESRIEGWGGG